MPIDREFDNAGRTAVSAAGHPSSGQVMLARDLAARAHRGQTDKAGVAYVHHPAAVAAAFDPELDWVEHSAAWLHDVVEDTDVTAEDLRAAGVAEEVVRVVVLLTRTPEVPDEEYYRRIRADSRARRVKLADIAHNTDPARRAALPAETRERLAAKYAKALAALT
jgi:(p)ppGpp synthase/HD superfamily hydrolase